MTVRHLHMCVCVLCVFVCLCVCVFIYDNVYNLFSICDQTHPHSTKQSHSNVTQFAF